MNNIDFKALAKTLSNEILFDIICNQKISKDELDIYMSEVKNRGLERELSEMIRDIEDKKNQLKNSVEELSNETLFNTIIYNIQNYEEEDLIIFKNEIENRGLGKELSEAIQSKKIDDVNFRNSFVNNLNDTEDLLHTFNEHVLSETTEMKQRVENEKRKKSLTDIIIGIVLILIGVALTFSMEGEVIFYGAILVGSFLTVKGIVKMINIK